MKRIIPYIIILALALHFFPGGALGQNKTKSLQECIRLAIDNNLVLKSGRISIERAKDLQGTAFNIEKTTLSLSQDPTSGGSPDNSISLSQGIDFPTIYSARKKLLKAETEMERSRFEVTRNELVKEITSTYYELLFAKENWKILQEQDSVYSKFQFLANAKYKSGETNQLERMNAERLYNENRIGLQEAEKNYQNIQLKLQRWINTEEVVEPADTSLTPFGDVFTLNEFNPELTPLGEVAANGRIISERNLSVVKQGYLPSFNLALKNQFLIKGFNPYDVNRARFDKGNFMGFEFGVSVPLFFGGQKAKVKAAKREVEQLRLEQEDTKLLLLKQYQSYLNEYYTAKRSLDYYAKQGVVQADEIARISQVSYEKGEINYIEYIQNLKTAVEIHLQYAQAIHDYNQTIISLNYLKGNK